MRFFQLEHLAVEFLPAIFQRGDVASTPNIDNSVRSDFIPIVQFDNVFLDISNLVPVEQALLRQVRL